MLKPELANDVLANARGRPAGAPSTTAGVAVGEAGIATGAGETAAGGGGCAKGGIAGPGVAGAGMTIGTGAGAAIGGATIGGIMGAAAAGAAGRANGGGSSAWPPDAGGRPRPSSAAANISGVPTIVLLKTGLGRSALPGGSGGRACALACALTR